MNDDIRTALVTYLTALGDDEFMLGHRDSEWTGLGPIIEEDIAFSSMAQDELGHALGIFELTHALGASDADTYAFHRAPGEYRNAVLTELPRGDYAFSLMRRYLYDAAENERLTGLATSADDRVRELAAKMLQEERYHMMHGVMMVERLAGGTEVSRIRMQSALDECFPYALGLFEGVPGQGVLVAEGLVPDEAQVRARWLARVVPQLAGFGLQVPAQLEGESWVPSVDAVTGGRTGAHTEHLLAILEAITMLSNADPDARW